MKNILPDTSCRRILIRAANWVGDAIMTTPVIRGVRKNYPGSTITVLAKPWVTAVYDNNPHVDEIMVYENTGRHKMGVGTLRLAKEIRHRKFDLAILMQNAFEAALLAFLAGVPLRVGYNTDARTLLLNPSIRLDPALKKQHLIDYYLGILTGAGLETDGRHMDLFISKTDQVFAGQLVSQTYAGTSGRVLGINPGATGGTAKRWFPDRYAALCRRLAEKYDTRIMIFGSPADHGLGEEIASMAQGCCINMAGTTTLGQAFALIQSCDLFVTNDSGLMHAAVALNTRQVAVIGSTDPLATAPDSPVSTVIRVPVSCSPCLKDECPTDHACMDRITVDKVFDTCCNILGTGVHT
ncbi:MAG: lipopolysaccharide heptosyltransferase II [Desulfotignum sp.]|nr:lipopolysaccharide heptosyltransferase II [Desulfotignum sp.]MCF8112819.1 lipopolysaccharide heptosyltransferase II [Desulfotignum sp.]MCF8124701.1 lipopolysaccharide heptosyltransferase II [Desulfotignum sp.]